MILVLCGKTCSGKDTIKRKLISQYDFKSIVTYTTRPKRKGEKNHKDYHFVSNSEFDYIDSSHAFAEKTSYKVANGETWKYGTLYKDIANAEHNSVIILNPDGLKSLVRLGLIDKCHVTYIYADKNTLCERLEKRGDNREEANRRLKADDYDFEDIMLYIDDKITNVNDLDKCVKELLIGYQERIEREVE